MRVWIIDQDGGSWGLHVNLKIRGDSIKTVLHG